MSIGLFSGAAAKSTADQLLQWKKIWQADEAREDELKLRREQMEHQQELQIDQQQFQERLAKLRNDWQNDLLDRKELLSTSELAIEHMPNMTLDQQWGTVENFRELGSPLVPLMENITRTGFFNDFKEARNLVNGLFTAEPGTKFDPRLTRLAAEQFASRAGWDEDKRSSFLADVDKALEERQQEGEEWDAGYWRERTATIEDAEATVDERVARTENIEARTSLTEAQRAAIFQETQFNAEKHGFILEEMQLQNQLLGENIDRISTENDYLPAQLTASLRNLRAQTQELENGNELFNRTVEYQVSQWASQAGIAEEELRHMTATSMARDALVTAQAEGAEAEVDQIRAAIGLTHSRTNLTDQQARALGVDMIESRVSIASMLVENGRGDLLSAVSDELLDGIVDEGEARDALIASLQETADSNLTNQERLEEANVKLAVAEADQAREEADTFWERYQDDLGLRERSVAVGERQATVAEERVALEEEFGREGLRIDRGRLDLARSQAAQGWMDAGNEFVAAHEAADAVADATGINQQDLQEVSGAATDIRQDLTSLRNNIERDPETGELSWKQGGEQVAQGILEQYNVGLGASPEYALQHIEGKVQAKTLEAENMTRAYVDGFMGVTGGAVPTAANLGFQEGDELYRNAIMGIPGIREEVEGQSEIVNNIEDMAYNIAGSWDEAGVGIVGAGALLDAVKDEHGYTDEELAAVGIETPSDLVPLIQPIAANYDAKYELANAQIEETVNWAGSDALNIESAADRIEAGRLMTNRVGAVDSAISSLEGGPWRGRAANLNPRSLEMAINIRNVLGYEEGEWGPLRELGIIDDQYRLVNPEVAVQLLTHEKIRLEEGRQALRFLSDRMR